LVREQFPGMSFHLGFTTFSGTVTAAHDWDQEPDFQVVLPAMEDSYEKQFHDSEVPQFWLNLRNSSENNNGLLLSLLSEEHLERAIGVVYRPATEFISHYLYANLPRQFDAIMHFDLTHALIPLEKSEKWLKRAKDDPETFPLSE
jgi:erythromycin esterase-like protein